MSEDRIFPVQLRKTENGYFANQLTTERGRLFGNNIVDAFQWMLLIFEGRSTGFAGEKYGKVVVLSEEPRAKKGSEETAHICETCNNWAADSSGEIYHPSPFFPHVAGHACRAFRLVFGTLYTTKETVCPKEVNGWEPKEPGS
ncbi:MAG: hypothetical protein LUQ69_10660 [Methanoregulaceae archaeon]|jgi:hypothetical protein|nr:hypothetical protein [Methanoregulaceae archaeon]